MDARNSQRKAGGYQRAQEEPEKQDCLDDISAK